jgi:hypothetical protein
LDQSSVLLKGGMKAEQKGHSKVGCSAAQTDATKDATSDILWAPRSAEKKAKHWVML